MKQAPNWNKVLAAFSGNAGVVFGDVLLQKNQVQTIHGVGQSPGAGGWPTVRHFNKKTGYGGKAYAQKTAQAMCDELGPNEKYLQQFVEEFANLCSLESRDACSPKDREVLEESEKMSKAERAAKIKEVEQEIKKSRQDAGALEKKAKDLEASLNLIKAGGVTVEKVEQLLNDADWRAHCESRTCIVAFLPHIYDDGAKRRNEQLKTLDEAFKASKKGGKDIGFLWSQGGDQFELEETLGLQFGFPAVIAVNFPKDRFAIHRGTFDKISEFLTSLSTGGAPLVPLPAKGKAVKAEPWDGKDAAPPVEEEL